MRDFEEMAREMRKLFERAISNTAFEDEENLWGFRGLNQRNPFEYCYYSASDFFLFFFLVFHNFTRQITIQGNSHVDRVTHTSFRERDLIRRLMRGSLTNRFIS